MPKRRYTDILLHPSRSGLFRSTLYLFKPVFTKYSQRFHAAFDPTSAIFAVKTGSAGISCVITSGAPCQVMRALPVGAGHPRASQIFENGVNTAYGVLSALRTVPGSTAYGEPT
ncbi:unannotated protein [freshwater metagenome]|uniref:Unannotated protein n=1 Tax=freshwater metagenome TaxID=449393 RepID=A0A6J6YSX5_9ZZZZ